MAIGRVKINNTIDIPRNNPKCNRKRIGLSNISVNPEINTIKKDDIANHIVIKLKAQANSNKENITVKVNQNHGDKKNLYMSINTYLLEKST
jgi:hypothetical protein